MHSYSLSRSSAVTTVSHVKLFLSPGFSEFVKYQYSRLLYYTSYYYFIPIIIIKHYCSLFHSRAAAVAQSV